MTARLPLIGLAGRPGSGKSTAAGILCDYHAFAQIHPASADMAHSLIDDAIPQIEAIAEPYHYSGIVIELPNDAWAAWLRARGGTVWHVIRGRPRNVWGQYTTAPPKVTERAGDRTLDNTGTLDALEDAIDYLLHGDADHDPG